VGKDCRPRGCGEPGSLDSLLQGNDKHSLIRRERTHGAARSYWFVDVVEEVESSGSGPYT
jgi:hypothetical protein